MFMGIPDLEYNDVKVTMFMGIPDLEYNDVKVTMVLDIQDSEVINKVERIENLQVRIRQALPN